MKVTRSKPPDLAASLPAQASAGWLTINAAIGDLATADSTDWNVYSHAMTALDAAFIATMRTPWKTYADAVSDASATQTAALANAYSAAVGRWAGQQGTSPFAAHSAALEAAKAARTVTTATAYNTYAKAQHTAAVAWSATVVPAWVTNQNDLSDHADAKTATTAPAWVTKENAVEDADLAMTRAAVPLGVASTTTLNTNFAAWVSSVMSAAQVCGDQIADHSVTWEAAINSADGGSANDMVANATTETHLVSGLTVVANAAVSEAIVNWAGAVSGQLTGTPYTPPTSTVTWLLQNSDNTTGGNNQVVAYGGNFTFPTGPSGIGPEWIPELRQRNPNGLKWNLPNGTALEWHEGVPGASGHKAEDHWHLTEPGRKKTRGNKETDYKKPGQVVDIAGLEEAKEIAKKAAEALAEAAKAAEQAKLVEIAAAAALAATAVEVAKPGFWSRVGSGLGALGRGAARFGNAAVGLFYIDWKDGTGA